MIEEIIISYLSGNATVPVYAEVPEEMPDQFIVIEKTGGSFSNRIKYTTIAVQSYAGRMIDAAHINEQVKDLFLDGLIARDEIGKVSLNSDYNFTDTSTMRYRYQAVFDIVYY